MEGVAVFFLFALLVGLDFAFVWALLAFLLNYIPPIGSNTRWIARLLSQAPKERQAEAR